MNVLIVGGAGYLGGAVTDVLQGAGHALRVYDLLLYEETYRKNVPFVYGDVRDTKMLKRSLDWADTVVWLAALVGDPACSLNDRLTEQINTRSLEFLVRQFSGRVIFMSTCSVYGAQDGLLDEQSALNPLSSYARSKIAAETVLGNRALIFRLGTLYGISDTYSRIRFDLVVNTLVMRAHLYNAITVFGGGQYRPLLHVRDAASAIAACLGRKETGVFNLHSENATILELGECLRGFFPSLRVDVSDVAFQDTRNYRVTSARAEKTLGFRPRLKVVDGVKELKQLLDEGRVKDVSIRRFSNFLHLKSLLVNYDSPIGRIVHPASEQ